MGKRCGSGFYTTIVNHNYLQKFFQAILDTLCKWKEKKYFLSFHLPFFKIEN